MMMNKLFPWCEICGVSLEKAKDLYVGDRFGFVCKKCCDKEKRPKNKKAIDGFFDGLYQSQSLWEQMWADYEGKIGKLKDFLKPLLTTEQYDEVCLNLEMDDTCDLEGMLYEVTRSLIDYGVLPEEKE